jgi:hypothetical protein
LAAEFRPPSPGKTDPPEVATAKRRKLSEVGQLQQRLIDHWRTEFAGRFRDLRSEAKARRR